MTWVALGILYGIGIGFTIFGSTIYLLILKKLDYNINWVIIILAIFFWPVTWGNVFYKLWERIEYERRRPK